MKAAGHSCATDLISLSSCHWQLLKTHHHGNKHDLDDHCKKGQRLPRSRQRHSACRVGEFVYVFCGKDGTSPLKDIWKYNIYHQTWEMVELRGGSLPLLQGHTAVAYKRLVVIFGGTFNNNVNDIQLWIFNTDLGHLREVWAEPGLAQPLCRRDHSAVMHNNLMYVFGGFKDPTGASQELWAFNMDEEEWTELTQMSHLRPSGRYGHTAVVADNAMWIFGGTAGLSPCTDFWRYSFSLHQWTKLKCIGSPPPTLSGHSTCVIHHQMIVVGGSCRGKPMNDIWNYRFDTNTWQKLNSAGMPLPGLSLHTCVSVSPAACRNQQWTDRALSTPHLKPSTTLLHPNPFVVRPRTSPSTLEETSPRAYGGEVCEPSGACHDTQVMSFEELTIDLGNTNSSNRTDPRIDVSHTERLVSDSPGSAGFYDSCIPFSPRHDNGAQQELQVLQQVSIGPGSDSESIVPDGTPCPREDSHKAVTIDLIDLSDSPVLKASKHSCQSADVIRKEITFWNDLFIEDLETLDDAGLDEVKISYPSKHPVLPLTCPVIVDSDGVEIVEDSSLPHWKTENSDQRQVSNHRWSPNLQDCPESHSASDRMSVHSTQPSRIQLVRPRLQSETGDSQGHVPKPDVPRELNQRMPENKGTAVLVQSQRSQYPPVNKHRPISASSQERPDRSGNRNVSDCDLEAETSFIDDVRDSGQSCLTLRCISGVSSDGAFSGRTMITAATDSFTASRSVPQSQETGGMAKDSVKGLKGAEDCAKEEMVLEEPFLLILGGKMEEQISIQRKPIAVWKGLFV